MGFGSYPAGFGPAGMDPTAASGAPLPLKEGAPAFDGNTRNFVQDAANGDFARQHPIDAKFFNRIRTRLGSVRSVPGLGQGVGNQQWIDPKTELAFVTDQVNLASADMVEAGEIALRGVTVDLTVRGRVAFQVDYTNLQTGKRQSLKL